MEEYQDIRIGDEISGLVTGNVYQVTYNRIRYEGTLEGLENNLLVLRSGKKVTNGHEDLVDRIEIPRRYAGRFEPL